MNVENGEWEFIDEFVPRSCIFYLRLQLTYFVTTAIGTLDWDE